MRNNCLTGVVGESSYPLVQVWVYSTKEDPKLKNMVQASIQPVDIPDREEVATELARILRDLAQTTASMDAEASDTSQAAIPVPPSEHLALAATFTNLTGSFAGDLRSGPKSMAQRASAELTRQERVTKRLSEMTSEEKEELAALEAAARNHVKSYAKFLDH